MAKQSVPSRELLTAGFARKRLVFFIKLSVPSSSLEMPHNLVPPSKRLTTRLTNVRWKLVLLSILGDFSAGCDDRYTLKAAVGVTKNWVPMKIVGYPMFTMILDLSGRESMSDMSGRRGLGRRDITRRVGAFFVRAGVGRRCVEGKIGG